MLDPIRIVGFVFLIAFCFVQLWRWYFSVRCWGCDRRIVGGTLYDDHWYCPECYKTIKKHLPPDGWTDDMLDRLWKDMEREHPELKYLPRPPAAEVDIDRINAFTRETIRQHKAAQKKQTVERSDGNKEWFVDGKLHREDGPAIERADGTWEWYINGKKLDPQPIKKEGAWVFQDGFGQRHRTDGPAVIWTDPNGDRREEWWAENLLITEKTNGQTTWKITDKTSPQNTTEWKPVMTVTPMGSKVWRLPNGQKHREDGPACECRDGTKFWYRYDKVHREDGPAIIRADGTEFWYLNGEKLNTQPIKEETEGWGLCWVFKDSDGKYHRDGGDAVIQVDGGWRARYQHGTKMDVHCGERLIWSLPHTSNPEYEKLENHPRMEALRDRMVKVEMPKIDWQSVLAEVGP
jgi:hypothetical protein